MWVMLERLKDMKRVAATPLEVTTGLVYGVKHFPITFSAPFLNLQLSQTISNNPTHRAVREAGSLVGPRIIHPSELPRYGEYAPKRLSVKPGITGLWQISRRQHICYDERVQLDMHYIDTRTFVLDLAILVTTPHGYKPWASGMTRPCRPTASKASAKIFLLPLWSRSMTRPQLEHS